MVAHLAENTQPVIGYFHAGADRIQIEKAHAKAGGKGRERNAREKKKGAEAGILYHMNQFCQI